MHKATSTTHVLVYVDDDPDDLQLVEDTLLPYSDTIAVRTFDTGSEAYTFLLGLEEQQEKPCLVLLDMNMPGLSGRELLPILRTIPFFDDVPVTLFTTSNAQHDYSFALRHNAGFITKPMTYQQMDLIAEQFLSHCSPAVRERLNRKA